MIRKGQKTCKRCYSKIYFTKKRISTDGETGDALYHIIGQCKEHLEVVKSDINREPIQFREEDIIAEYGELKDD